MNQEKPLKIFFSAAEASGDHHAASVISELKMRLPESSISGIGGESMKKAGCNLLKNMVDSSAMLLHVLGKLRFFKQTKREVQTFLESERPDVVVVVDSFAFNSHIAKTAKNLEIPVIYYVAPQLWAWAPWRIGKLKRTATRIACLLPFEQSWFSQRGVQCDYVGHPLFDKPENQIPDNKEADKNANFPTIALLCGSREHERKRLWEPMQTIARQIKSEFPNAKFISTTINQQAADALRNDSDPDLGIEIRQTNIADVTKQADLCLVASGTATLEVAVQHCPMIIMYYVNPIQWHMIGRWLINIPHMSLVNILAGHELMPEYMPFHNQTHKIAEQAIGILKDDQLRDKMRNDLSQLIDPIYQKGASVKAAQIIIDTIS